MDIIMPVMLKKRDTYAEHKQNRRVKIKNKIKITVSRVKKKQIGNNWVEETSDYLNWRWTIPAGKEIKIILQSFNKKEQK